MTLKKKYSNQKFIQSIDDLVVKLRKIGQNQEIDKEYQIVKQRLISYALGHSNFLIENQSDIRRAISVLIQETASMGDDVLALLIENNKLNSLFKVLEQNLDVHSRDIIAKKILVLYYTRYFSFGNLTKEEIFNFRKLMLESIDAYDGKSLTILKASENIEIFENNFQPLLYKYKNRNLKDIYKDLRFLEHYEIWQHIQIIALLNKVKSWEANQWDDDVNNTLENILESKDVSIGSRNLLEETAFIMLGKAKAINQLSKKWEDWFLEKIGDPRFSKNKNIWHRISEEYYLWFRALLSKGDVKEFLNNMTDGLGDTIYQYRRQFWLQYVDKIQYAKIMLSGNAISKLRNANPDIYQRFRKNPETYSKLSESERSCIFMDFGDFYVIEGTHKTKVRFYKQVPINLEKQQYNYSEFYNANADKLIIADFYHQSSESYNWQNKVRRFIDDEWCIHVELKDVILPEDIANLDTISNHLFNNGQSTR